MEKQNTSKKSAQESIQSYIFPQPPLIQISSDLHFSQFLPNSNEFPSRTNQMISFSFLSIPSMPQLQKVGCRDGLQDGPGRVITSPIVRGRLMP